VKKLIQFLPLIASLDNADDPAAPDQVQESPGPNQNEPNVADENKSNWKSTASATAKLLLRGVRESADAFPPLKSVAGGLCFILENCEVRPYFPTPFAKLTSAPANEGKRASDGVVGTQCQCPFCLTLHTRL